VSRAPLSPPAEQPAEPPTEPAASKTSRTPQAHAEPIAAHPLTPEPAVELKEYCTVAVCAGQGIEAVFRDLGVNKIITGGQTMNPSTENILEKINDAPSDVIFVLPNNRNIIMAAQQCIPLTDKQVFVIPTKSIPQGIAAMLSIDEADDVNEIASCMASAARRVRTALITKAARDSFFDGRQIKKGEYLALFEDSLAANGPDAYAVIDTIATALCSFSPEFITIFSGEGVGEADAAAVAHRIGSFSPNTETSVIEGDQPIYHFIISAE
jgi:dihydroxyacetone kinase-like predicted kinase